MDICKTLICLFDLTVPISPHSGIASSAVGLRCYQCTSDQTGSGPCVDSPDTDNIQVVDDCKGTCYVSYSRSESGPVTSRGCYSRKSYCTETCLDLFADMNNCQHCCDCNNCNDITKSSLESFGGDYDCGATTPQPSTTTFRAATPPRAPSVSTTVTTAAVNDQGNALPRGQAWRIRISWQILFIFALTASFVTL